MTIEGLIDEIASYEKEAQAILDAKNSAYDERHESRVSTCKKITKFIEANRDELEATLPHSSEKLSVTDTDLIIEFFREWIGNQTNRHGIMIPGDDWECYDTKSLRTFLAALEVGLISERIKELDLIIVTMEENLQALEALEGRGTLRYWIESGAYNEVVAVTDGPSCYWTLSPELPDADQCHAFVREFCKMHNLTAEFVEEHDADTN